MIWSMAVFFPLLAACICAALGRSSRVLKIMLVIAPLPALVPALAGDLLEGAKLGFFLLESELGPGPLDNVFLLLTSLAWLASALFWSPGSGPHSRDRTFCIMFLLTMCGNIGLAASRDAVSFYAFFALMTFCAFSLIVHTGTEHARRAGRVYLIMAVLGEGMLIAGIMTAVFSSPSHYFADISPALAGLPQTHPVFLLLFAGFGIKAGLMFLHFWLPLAHPVAPTPASAVLSGSMIKAGLLGWINFFPLGLASFDSWGLVLVILGLGSAFFGVLAGLAQKDPKTVLAYSSISQMGLMSFCLGLGLMNQENWLMAAPALGILVLTHALCKSALFLGTAVAGSKPSSPVNNLMFMILLAVPALALAGAPLTGGGMAKHLLKETLQTASVMAVPGFLVSLSSLATALLMSHFIRQTVQSWKSRTSPSGWTPAWSILTIAALLLPLLFHLFYPWPGVSWTSPALIISALWPAAAGIAAYLSAGKAMERAAQGMTRIMPHTGIVIDMLWHHFNSLSKQHGILESGWGRMNFAAFTASLVQSRTVSRVSRGLELKFLNWKVFGLFIMLLTLIFSVLAWNPG